MRGFGSDLRYALRMLVKSPGFSVVAVLTLATGIGANTAIFSILNAMLLRPLPFAEPDRLIIARATFLPFTRTNLVSAMDYRDYRDSSDVFQSLAAIRGFPTQSTITGGTDAERLASTSISRDLLSTLQVQPQIGRAFSAEEDQPGGNRAVLISHAYWQRRFGGSPGVVGQPLVIDGNPCTVVGVLPPRFRFLLSVDLWFPMGADSVSRMARRFHNWILLGRLKPGVTPERAQSQMDVISQRLQTQYPDSNRGKGLSLVPLHSMLVERTEQTVLILMGAVGLVLLIACGNVAGLLLARGSARRREFAMRAALGASSGRILRQVLTESLSLAGAGALLGVALGLVLQRALVSVIPVAIFGGWDVKLDAAVLAFVVGVSVLTAFLFGIAPALRAGRGHRGSELHAGTRATEAAGRIRLRGFLVAGQIALSLILLVGAGLLLRTLMNLQGMNLGFDPSNLMTTEIALAGPRYDDPARRIQFFTELRDGLGAAPEVRDVAIINLLPVREPRNNTRVWAAERYSGDPSSASSTYIRNVVPGYFEAMKIPLLAGRTIQDADRTVTRPLAVINQSLARVQFGGVNPVGRTLLADLFRDQPVPLEVVGVVGDERMGGQASDSRPAFYQLYFQTPSRTMQVAVRARGAPAPAVQALRAVVKKLDPNIALSELISMEELIGRAVFNRRFLAGLLTSFAGVAVFLAALGLYGVLAFEVARRSQETGVRMALGARASQVVGLFLRRGILMVVGGLVVGILGSVAAARLLGSLLFQVPPSDGPTFLGASLLFLAVAALACLIPAWRAARVDPVVSLRVE